MDYWMTVPLAILAVVFIIYLVIQHEKKRREAFKALSMRLGFTYVSKTGLSELPSANAFHLFNIGHNRRIKNLMRRSADGVSTAIYDYQYTTGGGQNSHTSIQTVFQFESDRLRLPAFILKPENVFHKIGQSFGYQDMDFDSHPDFSKRYLLRGKDEDTIRRLFTPEVITHMMSMKGIVIESNGSVIISYRSGKRVKPDDLFLTYEKMRDIYTMFARRSEYL